jgi:hypothetical protein
MGTHVAGYVCNFGFAGTDLMLEKAGWLARRAWGEWRNGRRAWLRTTWGNPCRFKSCLAHHFQRKGDSLPSRRVLLTRRKETVPIWYRPAAQELERKIKGRMQAPHAPSHSVTTTKPAVTASSRKRLAGNLFPQFNFSRRLCSRSPLFRSRSSSGTDRGSVCGRGIFRSRH